MPGLPMMPSLQKVVAQLFLLLAIGLLALPAWSQESDSGERTSQEILADILEDESARSQLIEELRRVSSGTEAGGELAETEDSDAPASLSRVMADATQNFAQGLVSEVSAAFAALSEIGTGDEQADYAELSDNALRLLLVIIATIVVFLALRRAARPVFARTSAWALKPSTGSALLHQALAVIAAAIVDFLVIALAWVTGYLVALFLVGETGAMAPQESLFLNAFLLIEIFKAVIRILFAARDDGLRILPMPAEDAAYWNAWLARLSGFIGYGLMLVVPLINANMSPAVGRLVTIAIMLVAFLYALAIILQNRSKVSARLRMAVEKSDNPFLRYSVTLLARIWHLLAIAYFAALTLVTLIRPEDALPIMLQATVQSLLAIGIGIFVSVVLTQIVHSQIHISEEKKQRFPMLEERLNGFIPLVLRVIHALIVIAVIAVVLDAWSLFNLGDWLASEAGSAFILKVITVGLILAVVKGLWIALASWIEHRLNPEVGKGEPSAREKTLLTIFRNAIAIALIIMTTMIVLAEIGINIGPLIAGAGVLGLAIGFGAQKLVQDIITGVFIQMENAINTGDVVSAGGVTGVAEKLTIRSLGLRDLSGTYHIVPFSSVDTVSNFMREFAFHVGDYGVAYRENTDEVIMRLREAFEELKADEATAPSLLSEELEVHGVTALADSSVNVRVRIKTIPGSQWAVGRAYNRLVKQHLDAAGIEIPFPHTTIYFGQDKDGTAPAAPIRLEQERQPEKPGVDPGQAEVNPKHKGDFDDADD